MVFLRWNTQEKRASLSPTTLTPSALIVMVDSADTPAAPVLRCYYFHYSVPDRLFSLLWLKYPIPTIRLKQLKPMPMLLELLSNVAHARFGHHFSVTLQTRIFLTVFSRVVELYLNL